MESALTYRATCTQCGTGQQFTNAFSYFKVCSNCRHTVYRDATEGKEVIKHQPLPEDFSIIKIGTKGKYNGEDFTVIGRCRIQLNNGFLNFWYLQSPTNKPLPYFIAEGMTGYAYVNFGKTKWQTSDTAGLQAGNTTVLPSFSEGYLLLTKSECSYTHYDGELPEMPLHFDFDKVYELNATNKKMGYFITNDKMVAHSFKGDWVTLKDLNLQNLRVDVKQKQLMLSMAAPLQMPCSECNKPITLYSHAQANYVVCPHCNSYLQVKPYGFKKEDKITPNAEYTSAFEIGSTGVIDGVEYTVLGYTLKFSPNDSSHWQEYYLFSPVTDFIFLSVYNGNWIKFTVAHDYNLMNKAHSTLTFRGLGYSLFNIFSARVVDAQGEFFHDVFKYKKIRTQEYINAPDMVSIEQVNDSYRWFAGLHLPRTKLKIAFANAKLPAKEGMGVAEPADIIFNGYALKVLIVSALLLVAIQYILTQNCDRQEVFKNSYVCTDSTSGKTIVTEPFELSGSMKDVEYHLTTDLSDSWFETSVVLVNEGTDESYEFSKGVEYYSGYTDGEHWSEGTPADNWIIPSVKGGRYHLLIIPYSQPGHNVPFNVRLLRDAPIYRNFYWAMFILLLLPVIALILSAHRNQVRWGYSSFNPYDDE